MMSTVVLMPMLEHLLTITFYAVRYNSQSHRFTRSWNHRITWAGRDLENHLIPTPLPQAQLPIIKSALDQAAQGPIQSSFEHLQWWVIRNTSGQHVPVPYHIQCKEFVSKTCVPQS